MWFLFELSEAALKLNPEPRSQECMEELMLIEGELTYSPWIRRDCTCRNISICPIASGAWMQWVLCRQMLGRSARVRNLDLILGGDSYNETPSLFPWWQMWSQVVIFVIICLTSFFFCSEKHGWKYVLRISDLALMEFPTLLRQKHLCRGNCHRCYSACPQPAKCPWKKRYPSKIEEPSVSSWHELNPVPFLQNEYLLRHESMRNKILPVTDNFVHAEFDVNDVLGYSVFSSSVDVKSYQIQSVLVTPPFEKIPAHLRCTIW